MVMTLGIESFQCYSKMEMACVVVLLVRTVQSAMEENRTKKEEQSFMPSRPVGSAKNGDGVGFSDARFDVVTRCISWTGPVSVMSRC